MASPAHATKHDATFGVGETFSYDSNPLRTTGNGKDLFGSTTSPTMNLRYETLSSLVESITRIDINQFNHSQFNSVDVHQKLKLERKNQRWTVGTRASYDRDTTRTSELTNYGLTLPKVHRNQYTAAPEIAFRASPGEYLRLNSSLTHVHYDDNRFTDYNLYSLTPAYERRLDPLNTIRFALSGQRYDASNNSLTSTSYGPRLGWTHTITPRLTSRLTGGFEHTNKRGVNAGSDKTSWNYVFAANLEYHGEQDTLDLMASRAREPFGNGTETLLTTVSIKERHKLNEKLKLNGTAIYRNADYSTEPGINLDNSATTGGGLAYTLYKNLDLTADYQFRHENLTNTSGSVNQHIALLGFTYYPSGKED